MTSNHADGLDTRTSEYLTALAVFRQYGVEPVGMTPDDLSLARRRIAKVSHPDHGGSIERMTEVNVAHDTLVRWAELRPVEQTPPPPNAPGPAPARSQEPYRPPHRSREEDEPKTPPIEPWLRGSQESRFGAVDGKIRREDYSDRNFIRKAMWERSRGPRVEFHVQAFDGVTTRGIRLRGSEDLEPDMVRAVSELHRAEGGDAPLAVMVRRLEPQWLGRCTVWVLGDVPKPVTIETDEQSINSPAFLQKLSQIIKRVAVTR